MSLYLCVQTFNIQENNPRARLLADRNTSQQTIISDNLEPLVKSTVSVIPAVSACVLGGESG